MDKIKIGRIKYINVLPIYYALEKKIIPNDFEFVYGTPSELNSITSKGLVDVGSVSSIEYARNYEKYYLVPDLSIGSRGSVKSVILKSKVSFEELDGKKIVVSAQTHTSFALLKVLLKKNFGISPIYRSEDVEKTIGSEDVYGFLAIGDEALNLRNHPDYPYTLDLGKAWNEWTGYPFIFGVWVANKDSVSKHPQAIKEACKKLISSKKWGCERIEFFCKNVINHINMNKDELISYFKHLIYDFGPKEKEGLLNFYNFLYEMKEISTLPPLRFLELN